MGRRREAAVVRARQAVSDLFPVDEVFAVEQRYAREILETTVDQIKVISCAADTRVGMETGNNGILITLPVL